MRLRAWSWWAALLLGAVRARELDPAACAPRFDVQRDKIIRTEESRDMGARYLSELDVGARHECLRLCCETDSCDVFVYEEKGPGSCYLFNCGPPEDFRCKFTAHSNFSSGVLAVSRRLAELQDQERLAHHEQELANLRSGGATSSTASTAAATTPPPPRSTPPAPPAAPAPHVPPAQNAPPAMDDHERPPSGASRCSRYQFACRRGGECIAVYNACDGVPQCADGSDEAPELGCPPPPAPAAPALHPAPPLTPATLKPLQESVEAAAAGSEDAPPERWPHRLAQAQPQHHTYSEGPASSHIFSHKGGLLQEPEGGAQFAPFEPPWPRRAWPQQPQQPQPSGMEGMSAERGWGAYWPEPDPRRAWSEPDPRRAWSEPDPRRAWPVPRPDQEIPVYIPPKTMPEVPVVYSSQQQTLRDSPKKGFELLKEPTEAPTPAEAPRDPRPPARHNNTNKLVKQKTVQTSKPSESADKKASSAAAHAHYPADEHDEHDGLSEHPPAAMMLLVLGLFMMAAMAGMLTCRARAAVRRRRARKSPFAHDADYLVNGMYL